MARKRRMTSLPEDSLHAHTFLRPMIAVLTEGVMRTRRAERKTSSRELRTVTVRYKLFNTNQALQRCGRGDTHNALA